MVMKITLMKMMMMIIACVNTDLMLKTGLHSIIIKQDDVFYSRMHKTLYFWSGMASLLEVEEERERAEKTQRMG